MEPPTFEDELPPTLLQDKHTDDEWGLDGNIGEEGGTEEEAPFDYLKLFRTVLDNLGTLCSSLAFLSFIRPIQSTSAWLNASPT
jgi:hypothetical protein